MDIFEALAPAYEPPVKAAAAGRCNRDQIFRSAAIVKTAFEVAGLSGCPEHLVYSELSSNPEPTTGNQKLASIGFICLSRAIQKTAGITSFLRGAGGAAAAVTPEALKALLLVGGIPGALMGGGAWLAQRGVTDEDEKLRSLEIQRDTYHQLAADVREELKRRKMTPTPANTAAAVDYLT